MRAGKGDRQLDQPEGGRAAVPRAGAGDSPLRRRRRRDGLRRAGPGRHRRAQGGDLRARVRAAHAAGRLRPHRPDLRPQHLRDRDRDVRARRLRQRLHRSDPPDQAAAAGHAHLGRPVERVVRLPRQRAGTPGDALGVPLPRDRRRARHGDRQRRAAGDLRGDRPGAARARRGRDPQPAAGRDGAAARNRRALPRRGGRRPQRARPELARAAGARAARARAGERHQRVHRRGHRGGAPDGRCAARHHRGAADGWHERRRRPVRRRQDVPAPGRKVGARDEAGGRAPRAATWRPAGGSPAAPGGS